MVDGPSTIAISHQPSAMSDEQCVLVVAAGLAGAGLPQLAERVKRGARRGEQRASLARRREDRRLHDVERLVDPGREIGKQLVGAFHLRGGELGGARRVAADRVEVPEQRLHFALELIGELADALRGRRGGDDHRNLCDRDRERRDGDDAEKQVPPDDHALSRRACWYASRPRSIAVVIVSRPWLMTSRPLAAASAARARASAARSPRYSRVSRPVTGAYSRASAAPLTAPRMNASRILPAPAPSSRDIRALALWLSLRAARPEPNARDARRC